MAQLTIVAAVTDSVTPGQPAGDCIAENVFDGNFSGTQADRWASDYSDNHWIYVDLGDTYALTELRIYWEDASASDYDIEVSDDASSWTSVSTGHDAGGAGLETHDLTGYSGRYVRVVCNTRATIYGFSIWEIEVFGDAVGGALTGQTASIATAHGAPVASTTAPATGQAAGISVAHGTVVPRVAPAPSGQAASIGVAHGTVAPSALVPLSGAAASLAVAAGQLSTSSPVLAGQAAGIGVAHGTATPRVLAALAGQALGLAVAHGALSIPTAVAVENTMVVEDSGGPGASGSLTLAGTNRLVIAFGFVHANVETGTYTATLNGVSMTELGSRYTMNNGTDDLQVQMFYMLDASMPTNGSYTLATNHSATITTNVIVAYALSGAAQEAPTNYAGASSESNTPTQVTLPGAPAADELTLLFGGKDSAGAFGSALNSLASLVASDTYEDVCYSTNYGNTTAALQGYSSTENNWVVVAVSIGAIHPPVTASPGGQAASIATAIGTALPRVLRPVTGAAAAIATAVGTVTPQQSLAGVTAGIAVAHGAPVPLRVAPLEGWSVSIGTAVGNVSTSDAVPGVGAGIGVAHGTVNPAMIRPLTGYESNIFGVVGSLSAVITAPIHFGAPRLRSVIEFGKPRLR